MQIRKSKTSAAKARRSRANRGRGARIMPPGETSLCVSRRRGVPGRANKEASQHRQSKTRGCRLVRKYNRPRRYGPEERSRSAREKTQPQKNRSDSSKRTRAIDLQTISVIGSGGGRAKSHRERAKGHSRGGSRMGSCSRKS